MLKGTAKLFSTSTLCPQKTVRNFSIELGGTYKESPRSYENILSVNVTVHIVVEVGEDDFLYPRIQGDCRLLAQVSADPRDLRD